MVQGLRHVTSDGLTGIYRTFHPVTADYIFFPRTQETFFFRIAPPLHTHTHKTNLTKFKKIEIISAIFLDHIGLKLEN